MLRWFLYATVMGRWLTRQFGVTTSTVTGMWSGWTPDRTTAISYYRTTVVTPADEPLLVLPIVPMCHPGLIPSCYNVIVDRSNGEVHDFEIMRLADDGSPLCN